MVVTATNGGRWVWYSTTARPGLVLLDWHGDRDPSSLRESSRRLHAGFLLVLRRSNLPALHAAVGCGPEVSPLCPAPPARTRLRSPTALRQGHRRRVRGRPHRRAGVRATARCCGLRHPDPGGPARLRRGTGGALGRSG